MSRISRIKFILLGMTFIVISIGLNGCSLSDKKNNLNKNDIVKVDDEHKTKEKDTPVLITFANLIGKSLDEVSNVLATKVKPMNTLDSSYHNVYLYDIEGESLEAVFSYNEDNMLEGIYTKLPDYEPQKWEQVLNKYLGTPTRLVNTSYSNEDEIITILWRVEHSVITLFGSYETLALLIE